VSVRPLGGNTQIIGSPDHVVDKLIGLKRSGCDGIQIAFFDFAPDLEFFGRELLPLMKQAGLRDSWARLRQRGEKGGRVRSAGAPPPSNPTPPTKPRGRRIPVEPRFVEEPHHRL